MKPYNSKQSKVRKSPKSESNQLPSYLILLVGLMGLVALSYDNLEAEETNNFGTTQVQLNQKSVQEMAIGIPDDRWIQSKVERVKIASPNLYPETNTPFQVLVKNFDPDLPLVVDFGDGSRQQISAEHLVHNYKKTGEYYVKLLHSENNKVKQFLKVIVSPPVEEGF